MHKFVCSSLTRTTYARILSGRLRSVQLPLLATDPSKVTSARRCFSAGSRWCQQQPASISYEDFFASRGESLFEVKSIPSGNAAHDIESWIETLEPLLPPTLRRTSHEQPAGSSLNPINLRQHLSLLLTEAQRRAGLDLLLHLGIVEDRWDAVEWIVKTIAEGWQALGPLWEAITPNSGVCFPKFTSLDSLTEAPCTPKIGQNVAVSKLGSSTSFETNVEYWEHKLQNGALGQIWRSLGGMILKVSASSGQEPGKIMPHVLSMIANLHHKDIIPEAVYAYAPDQDMFALRQPPTLHMLSSRILTALSDAAWNAHQAAATSATKIGSAHYSFLSSPLPGVRYKSQIEELRPEIWLEFVLWTCLHGGWVVDGANILEKMQEYTGDATWSLISWRQALHTSDLNTSSGPTFKWTNLMDILEGAGAEVQPRASPDERRQVEKTISSEVVIAYVDALINVLDVSGGTRGMPLDSVLLQVKQFKRLLDQQNLGLGYTTWEGIVQRFIESGGVTVEGHPSLTTDFLALVQPYGKEWESVNVPKVDGGVGANPYYINPSAMPLGLLHRVLRYYVDLGSIDGTLRTFRTLREYTDLNQRRSIERFFHKLKDSPEKLAQGPSGTVEFMTNLPSIEYPSFFPHVPIHILSDLLDLFTGARILNFSQWLLYSKDLDGPVIPETLHGERALAPALIRFAAATSQKKLLEKILTLQNPQSGNDGINLARPILTAVIESQMHRRRWDSVHRILEMTQQARTNRWHPSIVCCLAKEILRLQKSILKSGKSSHPESLARAIALFKRLIQMGYGKPIYVDRGIVTDQMLHSVIGVLSSISPEWANHCADLRTHRGNQPLTLPTQHFNTIFEGIVEAYGVDGGRRIWETWCMDTANLERSSCSAGRLETHVNQLSSRGDDYFDPKRRVILENVPNGPLEFYGRVAPNLYTVRIILRKLLQANDAAVEQEASTPRYTHCEMMDWVFAKLKALGINEEDVQMEIQHLEAALQWERRDVDKTYSLLD